VYLEILLRDCVLITRLFLMVRTNLLKHFKCIAKLLIDEESSESGSDFKEDDDDKNVFSEDELHAVNTPNTPLSPAPGRKRFPSELKTIKCTWEDCHKTFNRPARLTAHLRSHTSERPFACTWEGCNKAYMDNKHLKAHVKGAHTKERQYMCDWEGCGKNFLTSTRRNRHRATHEGTQRFVCTGYTECNQTFRKRETLQRHIRSDHLQLAPFPCMFVDPITGHLCDAGFDGAGGLRKHQDRVHSTPQFFCPECTQPGMVNIDGSPAALGFTSEGKLQAHIRKDHVNCLFCDLRCSSRRELDKHVESQHSGTTLEERKKVPCTYPGCTKMFTKPYNRNQHIATAHEEKRFTCGSFDLSKTADIAYWDQSDACGNEFFSKANLEDHVRTAHLGLQSTINANRIKTEESHKPAMPTALQELTGTAYLKDERRTITCYMPKCFHKFIRDYDLQNHLRGSHRLTTPVIDEIIGSRISTFVPEDLTVCNTVDSELTALTYTPSTMEQIITDSVLDEDWLSKVPQDGVQTPYWIGADDGAQQAEQVDPWAEEEKEMRRLIDEEILFDGASFVKDYNAA